jgi:hypothetical protein
MPRGVRNSIPEGAVTRELIKKPPSQEEIDREAFMHEWVTVRFEREKGVPASVPITLRVNEDFQHVLRGTNAKIRRKYVEVAARAVTSEIPSQSDDDVPFAPGESPASRQVTTPMYAFNVLDDTPKGREWLDKIRAESFA